MTNKTPSTALSENDEGKNHKQASAKVLHLEFLDRVEELSRLFDIPEKSPSRETLDSLGKQTQQLLDIANAIDQPGIRVVVEKIHQLVQKQVSAGTITTDVMNTLHSQLEMLRQVTQIHLPSNTPIAVKESTHRIHHLLVSLTDEELMNEIIQQVKYFNYTCTTAKTLTEVFNQTSTQPPETFQALLLDTELCKDYHPKELLPLTEKIPVIFISFDDSAATRLFAVQAGGSGYLLRPIEFTQLIEKIDQIAVHQRENMPYRVLIVEDSKTQAKFVQKYLEEAGMITETINKPLDVNKFLQEFQPELILMDLYMPECSGFELTKLIRQQDPYTSIPIVYLSAEEDVKKQLYAITIGGDDFLTKPIDPAHLVMAVQARAGRARTLRSEMIQDSLTGLLNHTRILEQLDLEIARAKRNQLPLTFVMIDIDFFKLINDNHGHPIGDRVIKGLARLLKQRLRTSDSVGRYGGEEFALILPQSTPQAIYALVEDIRISFSKLLHQSSDPLVEFTATLSCGVAEYTPENDTVGKLVQAADKALYAAKSQGRNCIVIHD